VIGETQTKAHRWVIIAAGLVGWKRDNNWSDSTFNLPTGQIKSW